MTEITNTQSGSDGTVRSQHRRDGWMAGLTEGALSWISDGFGRFHRGRTFTRRRGLVSSDPASRNP